MRKQFTTAGGILFLSALSPFVLSLATYAASDDVVRIQSFMLQIVQILAGFAVIVSTGFIVYGGILMSANSGHPDRLERSKRTLFFSMIGLAITILAFVIINAVSQVAKTAAGN